MKKITVLIAALIMLGSFGCKKEKAEAQAEPAKPPAIRAQPISGSTAASVAGRTLEPELFFKFELERLKVNQEYQVRYLQLLKSAKGYSQEFETKRNELIQEMGGKMKDATDKFKITREDLQATYENSETRQALKTYQDSHPELKKQMENLYQELHKMSEEIQTEKNRISPAPPPGPGAPQGGGRPVAPGGGGNPASPPSR